MNIYILPQSSWILFEASQVFHSSTEVHSSYIKSIAYSLTFNDPSRTLTEEEVMNVFNKIITDVEKSGLGKLRDN